MTTSAAIAQNFLTFKVKGIVCEISGAKAIKVAPGSKLNGDTRLRINNNSEIWIVENNNRRAVYKFRTTTGAEGKTIKELVTDAKSKTLSSIATTNKNLLQGLSLDKIDKTRFDRAGVSRISMDSPDAITTLAYLLGPDGSLQDSIKYASVNIIDDGDNLYHFSIKNDTEMILFANIILKDPKDVEPLLPECVFLPIDKEINLKGCQFYTHEKPFGGYILILSNEPFTAEQIKSELISESSNPHRIYLYQIIK
ncbi:MAG: hypothetical protein NC111_03260 [Bacteroides sp.]|nr:hypothetical protein [Bacteroides sp.]MCM1412865.1 hypothetical protein [Bacteroides sp.]MCM1471534.1 hypothetical protein [Bacteroides sp.]